MKHAEFEEKEYEGFLYSELDRGVSRFWHPGQVLENYLGFDRAMFLDDPYFWRMHGIRGAKRGLLLSGFPWPFLPRKLKFRLPRFRYNCFVQAKRPQYGSRLPLSLSALGTTRPFFKFQIDTDQQATLEAAAARLRRRALFCYAAPVFFKSRDLFRYDTAGSIVANSTFPDIDRLAGQHAWYYNQPGASGIANRSYEHLQMPPLNERVEELIRADDRHTEETQSPSAALGELFHALEGLFKENHDLAADPRAAYLTTEWRRISALADEIEAPPALLSFLSIEAFAVYFNLVWLTIA